MPVPPFLAAWRPAALGLILSVAGVARTETIVRVLSPDVLELEWVQPHVPKKAGPAPSWNLARGEELKVPGAARFAVEQDGRAIPVRAVGGKRRVVSARLGEPELRLGTWLYLQLAEPIGDEAVRVRRRDDEAWPAAEVILLASRDEARISPALHVSQEGYAASLSKKAMVGYYLGTLGELEIGAREFRVVGRDGRVVFRGKLQRRPDEGFNYEPLPYQEVWEADFTSVRRKGDYRLVVDGVGASRWFRIDDDIVLGVLRAYALGLYHQRCGVANEMPYTRFGHAACHCVPAEVPLPSEAHAFTWNTLARLNGAEALRTRAAIRDEAAQLFPIVRRGAVDVSGGHHDAGDYSKYTTNSAALIHVLVFAVDALPGAAERDDLGWPESGDGVPDLLQAAKHEADFLAKMQDDDGGFHFLVYPRDRAYENDVLPDQGDPQVVWPKNTAATAAAVAALAQASASPEFRRHFPEAAEKYARAAERGWEFIEDAMARRGKSGAYQRITHYGDNFGHDDELAWAACELFLATGDEEYHARFREWCDPRSGAVRRWGWWRLPESWGNAIRSYAFAEKTGRMGARKLDARWREACEGEIDAAGRDALRWAEASAYGTSFPTQTKRMRGGGWYFSLATAFDLAVASELKHPPRNDPRGRFLEAYATNLGYELGVNPVNLCYVTGLGDRSPREIVHQFAQNDRRVLPPSGLPVGNVQAGLPYWPQFKEALRELSYPADGAARAPYPYYDRWSDLPNVSTEFVITDQARALAGLCWLAGKVGLGNREWRPAAGRISGAPSEVRAGDEVKVRFEPPEGMKVEEAEIVWEAAGGKVGEGPEFGFVAEGHGAQWIEAEARWPDGRRVFAVAEFVSDNGRPEVSVVTSAPEASVGKKTLGAVTFRRKGDWSAPLTVRFELRGTAAKWSDYRRPEGDMPQEMVIPAGAAEVTMRLAPVAKGLAGQAREVVIRLKPTPEYNLGAERSAAVKLLP